MQSILHALADPRRRAIVEMLRQGEQPVGRIVDELPIAQSGVSRHLRILRDAGLVVARPQGQQRVYALRPEPLQELSAWLDAYRFLWEERLDRFEDALRHSTNTPV